jgi:hypothetical protein
LDVTGGIATANFICMSMPKFNWSNAWVEDMPANDEVVGGSFSCKIGH